MNCVFTPDDIAIFLLKTDFTLSDEQMVLYSLWEEKRQMTPKDNHDKFAFIREIRREMTSYKYKEDMHELDLIMREIDPDYVLLSPKEEYDYIFKFFKVIRLELLYIMGKEYYKIKLRNLLKRFGYKRRSQSLINHITQSLTILSLTTYLRGHIPCDVKTIALDDMVMIRLKQ